LTAVVNGTSFTAIAASAIFSGGSMGVAGQNTAGASVGFGFNPTTACTGTYAAGTMANGTYSVGTMGWVTSLGGSGTFVITACTNDRVAGTFEFVAEPNTPTGATGSVSVTSGVFDVPRSNQ
jgi:hypothetical protein